MSRFSNTPAVVHTALVRAYQRCVGGYEPNLIQHLITYLVMSCDLSLIHHEEQATDKQVRWKWCCASV